MAEPASGSPVPSDDPIRTATTVTPPDRAPVKDRGEPHGEDRQGAEAGTKGRPKKHGFLGFIRELPGLVLMAFVLALLIKTFLVQAFYIPSPSMEPTLKEGDRVLVNKLGYRFGDVHRGDVLVFADPDPQDGPDRGIVGGFLHWLGEGLGFAQPQEEDFIKRVVGLPGETVEIRNNKVFIEGQVLKEPYLTDQARQFGMSDYGPVAVPPGRLFVMGDNRANSNDSRGSLGFVPIDRVVGKAFVIIWPPSRVGWLRGL